MSTAGRGRGDVLRGVGRPRTRRDGCPRAGGAGGGRGRAAGPGALPAPPGTVWGRACSALNFRPGPGGSRPRAGGMGGHPPAASIPPPLSEAWAKRVLRQERASGLICASLTQDCIFPPPCRYAF